MDIQRDGLFVELTEAEVGTLQEYAKFMNVKYGVVFNWRKALGHLFIQARVDMGAGAASVTPEQADLFRSK